MANKAELLALAERVEAGSGEDRELDLSIARTIVPDVIVLRRNEEGNGNEPHTYWKWSSSIDDVEALRERLLPYSTLAVDQYKDRFDATIWPCGVTNLKKSSASTESRARLAALLRAYAGGL